MGSDPVDSVSASAPSNDNSAHDSVMTAMAHARRRPMSSLNSSVAMTAVAAISKLPSSDALAADALLMPYIYKQRAGGVYRHHYDEQGNLLARERRVGGGGVRAGRGARRGFVRRAGCIAGRCAAGRAAGRCTVGCHAGCRVARGALGRQYTRGDERRHAAPAPKYSSADMSDEETSSMSIFDSGTEMP